MPPDPLHDWAAWQLPCRKKPRLLRELTGGHSNRTYLIDMDGQLCALRRGSARATDMGIDRVREQGILELASAAGLAPRVVYCAPEHDVLISDYIEGRHLAPPEGDDAEYFSRLLATLNAVHKLGTDLVAFDYYQHAEHYWRLLLERQATISDELYRQRETLLPTLLRVSGATTLCHHDPTPANLVATPGKLYFLDWEYAAPGWAALDYAALGLEWQLDPPKVAAAAAIDVDEFALASEVYRYFCDLWDGVQAS